MVSFFSPKDLTQAGIPTQPPLQPRLLLRQAFRNTGALLKFIRLFYSTSLLLFPCSLSTSRVYLYVTWSKKDLHAAFWLNCSSTTGGLRPSAASSKYAWSSEEASSCILYMARVRNLCQCWGVIVDSVPGTVGSECRYGGLAKDRGSSKRTLQTSTKDSRTT